MVKDLTIGFSPCPNDTFMFNAVANGTVGIEGYRLEPVLHDIETLNGMTLDARQDISKLSFHAWLAVKAKYRLLSSGTAMRFG